MKIGLAIAPEDASPSAFVVFRDRLETSMEKAARLGYDGVELALLNAQQAKPVRLRAALERYGLEMPVISTGRVFSEGKVWCTHPDATVRRQAVETLKGLVVLAAHFGSQVNLGRVRGFVHDGDSREAAEARFVACLRECADFAGERDVELLLEPVNHYEINYINSVPEALDVLRQVARPNVKVMPDVYHMNIEDTSITGSLRQAGKAIGYVHLADSNRQAPGRGHLDFRQIVATLREVGYDGYVTAEILPHPDPDSAAGAAIAYLRGLVPAEN